MNSIIPIFIQDFIESEKIKLSKIIINNDLKRKE